MLNKLPKSVNLIESGIVNLDSEDGDGTHWVAYRKIGKNCEYFDSFGDLQPPIEIRKYLNSKSIKYNYTKYQNFDTVICGHLCLKFLYNCL